MTDDYAALAELAALHCAEKQIIVLMLLCAAAGYSVTRQCKLQLY